MARPAKEFSSFADPISGSDACFSSDGFYRWWLRRQWAPKKRRLIFIGLNPSRANARDDDPTLRRLIDFAHRWGFGDLVVLNLFARTSPDPAALRTVCDPVGIEANAVLCHWASQWSMDASMDLWCGWGEKGVFLDRSRRVQQLLNPSCHHRQKVLPEERGPLMLGLTRGGQPRHPLFAPKDKSLVSLVWAETCSIRHPETRLPDTGSY